MSETKSEAEALLPQFKTERLLNQDSDGRRVSLLGSIASERALLVIERGPFDPNLEHLSGIPSSLSHLQNLGSNDVYRWYLGTSGSGGKGDSTAAPSIGPVSASEASITAPKSHPDLKLNLFYPASDKHIRKYSPQRLRVVHETPKIYATTVRPWVERTQRAEGRVRWIYDILEGRAEAEDVIYREGTTEAGGKDECGLVLLPDLNWDRRTADALHLLVLVERRDIWSVRDLRRRHVPWLRAMQARILAASLASVPGLEIDQVKMYLHYQPTYYHLHIHVVHVALDGGASQTVGKAIGLDSIISTLEMLPGGDNAGMQDISLTYNVGEESEIWKDVWRPIKTGELKV